MVNNTLISLNPLGSLLIGTSTIPLQSPTPVVIITDGQALTVEQGGPIAVDGVTLSSGGPGTVISGTPISVGSGGVVVGSDTVRLPTTNGSVLSTPRIAESSRLILWGSLVAIMAL